MTDVPLPAIERVGGPASPEPAGTPQSPNDAFLDGVSAWPWYDAARIATATGLLISLASLLFEAARRRGVLSRF